MENIHRINTKLPPSHTHTQAGIGIPIPDQGDLNANDIFHLKEQTFHNDKSVNSRKRHNDPKFGCTSQRTKPMTKNRERQIPYSNLIYTDIKSI